MDEQAWLSCTDPTPMLDFLRSKTSPRKLRLFACGCWRQTWQLLTKEEDRKAVVTAERVADGLASAEELPEAFDENGRSACPYVCYPVTSDGPYHADVAAYMSAMAVVDSGGDTEAVYFTERAGQADLIRDIVGNPFRPITLTPSCLTPTVLGLAQAIYNHRTFGDLPVLADSLEEAGCTEAELLAHLRSPGLHTKGCWALDLVLGKS